jgi:hypothetical protein
MSPETSDTIKGKLALITGCTYARLPYHAIIASEFIDKIEEALGVLPR